MAKPPKNLTSLRIEYPLDTRQLQPGETDDHARRSGNFDLKRARNLNVHPELFLLNEAWRDFIGATTLGSPGVQLLHQGLKPCTNCVNDADVIL
jgi:hypothetical protein